MTKSLVVLAMAFALTMAGVAVAGAETGGSAMAHVFLDIDPNIAVNVIDSNVDGGDLQTGDRQIPITFRIDANTEAVSMSALVTKLYKGDDPSGTEVEPIPVNENAGVVLDPDNANPMNGGSNIASYASEGSVTTDKGTFQGHLTEEIIFESSQNGHFSQNVEVTPTWTNDDDEKPQGQYSGYVVLYSAVVT